MYSVVSIPYNRQYSCVGLSHLKCTNEELTKALTILHVQHKLLCGGLQDDSCLQGPPSLCSPIALRFYFPSLALNQILWQSHICCLCRVCLSCQFHQHILEGGVCVAGSKSPPWSSAPSPYTEQNESSPCPPLSLCRIIVFMLNVIFLLTFLDVPLNSLKANQCLVHLYIVHIQCRTFLNMCLFYNEWIMDK